MVDRGAVLNFCQIIIVRTKALTPERTPILGHCEIEVLRNGWPTSTFRLSATAAIGTEQTYRDVHFSAAIGGIVLQNTARDRRRAIFESRQIAF
jgi:hypothetical protein